MKTMKHLTVFAWAALLSTALVSCHKDDEVETETKTETGSTDTPPASSDEDDVHVKADVSYTLTLTSDLLKFVTPEVRYVDARGEVVTLTGVDELDGQVAESGSAGSWTSDAVPETGWKKWTVRMEFEHLDFHSYMTVTYRRNEVTEDTAGKTYYFDSSLNSDMDATISKSSKNGIFISIYRDRNIKIDIGSSYYYSGDDIDTYLDELCAHEDKVGYYIDESGDVSRRAEGE